MKFHLTLPFLGVLVCAPAFAEQKISVEVGPGSNWSKAADAGFVRYSDEIHFPNFPEQEGFYELSAGSWKNKVENNAIGLAIGTRERWNNFHLDGSAGVAVLENKTSFSQTHQQFILRVGGGYTVGQFDFGVYRSHYSNARVLFNWEGKNVGYDFITFQIGYLLK